MLSGRNENGINYYTARKLKDMSQSLEQLAKAFDDGAGETGSLTKYDGLAAMQTCATLVCGSCGGCSLMRTAKKRTVIICIIFCVFLSRTDISVLRTCRSFLRRTAAENGII